MISSKEDRLLIKSTVDMVHGLSKSIVAEGIENTESMDFLVKLGCDIGQGYFVGRPMKFSDFQAYVDVPKWIGAA